MKKENQRIYDWNREGDFASGFHGVATRTVRDLDKEKLLLSKSREAGRVLADPLDQATRNLLLINSLSRTVVSFFSHNDNFSKRNVQIQTGYTDHSRISYGVHRVDGEYGYGLFYHAGTPKKPFVNPRPLTQDLLKSLWVGQDLPPGVNPNKSIIRKLGSRSQMDVLCQFIKEIKPSAKSS